MSDAVIERRLKQLEKEKKDQEKYLRDIKMLDVMKFFKRTSESPVVSHEEFIALKDGLECYGVNLDDLISEDEKYLFYGEKLDYYKTLIKK